MKQSLRFDYTTGAAAVDITLKPGQQFKIIEVRVHLSAAGGSGNLTVTVDSGENSSTGTEYDTVLKTQDMTSIEDLMYQPSHPFYLDVDDAIKIAWANSNTRTYGITVVYEVY